MTKHILKTDPEVFEASFIGKKRFEIRLNDRDFKTGDVLQLVETVYSCKEMAEGKPLKYTGRNIINEITFILENRYGLLPDWCALSINPLVSGYTFEPEEEFSILYDLANDYSLDKSDKTEQELSDLYEQIETRLWNQKSFVYVHKEYNEEHYIRIFSNHDFSGRYYR